MTTTDAVVIGSGPNGLVAANLLADAGWDVAVVETQPEVGGAVRSDSSVEPGFVHDTCSSFYPLAVASPVIRGLDLESHGLRWRHAPAVVGTPFANGEWAVQYRSADETAAALDALEPGDGAAWLALYQDWTRVADQVLGAVLSPFPPLKHGLAALARLPRAGGLSMVRTLLAPVRTISEQHFRGSGPRILLAANAAHADIPMDASGSGLMGILLAMIGQQRGYPVPEGGAGMLTGAMSRRLQRAGGEVRVSTRAERVVVRHGRAVGVVTEHGELLRARHAVVADVSAPSLYGGLVAWDHLPVAMRAKMSRFVWDPATVKVDWALDGPIPWKRPPDKAPGTVHLAESVDELSLGGAQVISGAVPARPFLVVGQMAAADPARAPAGCESVWAYTHVPQAVESDAGDGGIRGEWDETDKELMADRMQQRIEEYAPGFSDVVRSRRVLGPRELEAHDENLVNGALNGGTAGLHQQLVFRPVPGLGRAETPVKNLYLGSASAHPGGGVHGACGANAARAALAHARVRRLVGGRGTPPRA